MSDRLSLGVSVVGAVGCFVLGGHWAQVAPLFGFCAGVYFARVRDAAADQKGSSRS